MDRRFGQLTRKSTLGFAGAIAALALFAGGGQASAQAQIGGALLSLSTQTGSAGGVQPAPQGPAVLTPTLKDNPSAPTPTQQQAAVPVVAAPAGAPAAASSPEAPARQHQLGGSIGPGLALFAK